MSCVSLLLVIVLLAASVAQKAPLGYVPVDEDVGRDMPTLIGVRGYTVETHYATTPDGYILTMFRIPFAKGNEVANKRPVLLQHGLLDSSYTWINNYEDQSLGYVLADAGYDVWFGNNRGNRYGRNHTTLDPDSAADAPAFWDFSWDEMASLDAPTLINYVLNCTGAASTAWVGHSEGTTQMWAAASIAGAEDDAFVQEALSKLDLFVALAPAAFVSGMKSPFLVKLAESDLVERMLEDGHYEFLPFGPVDTAASQLCHLVEHACDLTLMAMCGPSRNINASRIQVYVSETPAGTSTVNMAHWMQGVRDPTFQRLDMGSAEANEVRYGTSTPPPYDMSKIAVPTAVFWGKHDWLADPDDVQKILDTVPAEMLVFVKEQTSFAHLDYTWAPAARTEVYDDVVKLLDLYVPQ